MKTPISVLCVLILLAPAMASPTDDSPAPTDSPEPTTPIDDALEVLETIPGIDPIRGDLIELLLRCGETFDAAMLPTCEGLLATVMAADCNLLNSTAIAPPDCVWAVVTCPHHDSFMPGPMGSGVGAGKAFDWGFTWPDRKGQSIIPHSVQLLGLMEVIVSAGGYAKCSP